MQPTSTLLSAVPGNCERHGRPLIRKIVYQPGREFLIGDPAPEHFIIAQELPHYLPEFYSESPDKCHTEAVEVLVCEACQSDYPQTLAQIRARMREREVKLEEDVRGYFQLSDLSEFVYLKKLVPGLSETPSVEVMKRLREEGLRWRVGTIKRWQAERYQSEAAKYGLAFKIT